MGFRKSRLKLLLVFAIIVTLYLLYQTYENKLKHKAHREEIRKELEQYEKELKLDNLENNKALVDSPSLDKMNVKNDIELSIKQFKNQTELRSKVADLNFKQEIHLEHIYGDISHTTVVILIQVHNRPELFQELINSLKSVKGIDKASLVISTDYSSPEIDSIIDSINFCRYVRIFFPFSMQLYPDSFPGESPDDCPRDISKAEAQRIHCNNAEFPDKYGHYREVDYVQIKHHWFWKLHMVFSGLRAFKTMDLPILLLEEDYYVAADILHVMKKAIQLKDAKCPTCLTISLGNYEQKQDYESDGNNVDIRAWTSSKHNLGMVITRKFYNHIVAITDTFCDYDDYNWDWSLQYAFTSTENPLFTIVFKGSRLFHLGSCGLHSHKDCDVKKIVAQAKVQFSTAQLFPDMLHVALHSLTKTKLPRPNGGWGDIRDHTLCKQYKSICEKTDSK